MEDAPLTQLLAHHPGQGTALGLGQVPNAELRGVQLIAGAQGREDGKAAAQGGLDQVQLAGNQVDAVHHIVVPRPEKPLPGLRLVFLGQNGEAAFRVDVRRTFRHGLGLGPAQGGDRGFRLPVQVGKAHLVMVDEGERAHAGAGQGLGAPAAHAAQAEYGHVGGVQPRHAFPAQEHFRA